MGNKVIFKDLGMIRYGEAWDYQKNLFQQVIELKTHNSNLPFCEQNLNYNFLLFCEHPHVYTLGKSGTETNLLVDEYTLKKKGVDFVRIDRGGDITYHGPGQIVGYPIIDLEAFSIGIKQYIYNIEEAIILTLKKYSIIAGRLPGASGVWLDPGDQLKTRKICAIGVKISRYVSMHGFAFNVNTDLNYYRMINPCGFVDKGVTSMKNELGNPVDMEDVKTTLKESFREVFGFDTYDYQSGN